MFNLLELPLLIPEEILTDLQQYAQSVRTHYLKKTSGSNVAVATLYLRETINPEGFTGLSVGATSKGGKKSPLDVPQPRSQGGQFEPSVDSRTQRLMDTDAEYKVISEMAKLLERTHGRQATGSLYLYTELQPCESCDDILNQFKSKFPRIECLVDWAEPYP